jgi:hypothetical protein
MGCHPSLPSRELRAASTRPQAAKAQDSKTTLPLHVHCHYRPPSSMVCRHTTMLQSTTLMKMYRPLPPPQQDPAGKDHSWAATTKRPARRPYACRSNIEGTRPGRRRITYATPERCSHACSPRRREVARMAISSSTERAALAMLSQRVRNEATSVCPRLIPNADRSKWADLSWPLPRQGNRRAGTGVQRARPGRVPPHRRCCRHGHCPILVALLT